MYQVEPSETSIKARRGAENRNILGLLGGSRQVIAVGALEAVVFTGDCPAAPIIRCMNLPQVAGSLTNRTNLTGLGAPVLDQRLPREE